MQDIRGISRSVYAPYSYSVISQEVFIGNGGSFGDVEAAINCVFFMNWGEKNIRF